MNLNKYMLIILDSVVCNILYSNFCSLLYVLQLLSLFKGEKN